MLDHVLQALGIPAENNDLHTRFLDEQFFEIKTAFLNEDWVAVTQKYSNLFKLYPSTPLSTAHYRYAIALMKQGQIALSQKAVHEALALQSHTEDADLLHTYAQCFKEKGLWHEILFVAEKALEKFPDARWLQLRLEASTNYNRTSSSFLHPQDQSIGPTNLSSNTDMRGAPQSLLDNQNHPLSYFQPISPFSHNGSSSNHRNFSSIYEFSPQTSDLPTTGQFQIPLSDLSHTTKKLSEEELQSEEVSNSQSDINYFIGKYFSRHKLKRLMSSTLLIVTFLNLLYLLLLSHIWSFTVPYMAIEAAVILAILCTGRMTEAAEIKFFCLVALSIFWIMSGYCLGNLLHFWLKWGTDTAFNEWVELVCIILLIALGLLSHVGLLYSDQ